MPMQRSFLPVWLLFCWTSFFAIPAESAPGPASTLWYRQPAQKWTDALPVGNGRMGAMAFGRVFDERIQFNEDTLWKGHPHDYVRAGAHDHLAEIRQLLFDGNTKEAENLARKTFLSDPVRQKAYQPFGDLHLCFPEQGNASEYRRELDLDSAIVRTTYRLADVQFERDVFASHPDHAIVVRITADHPASVSFTLTMDSPQTNSRTASITSDTLALTGQVEEDGLRFESRVRAVCDGGSVTTNGNAIVISKANSATLFLAAATSFKDFQDISGNPTKRCARDLAAVSAKKYEAVLAAHEADYRSLFRRARLELGGSGTGVPPVRFSEGHATTNETHRRDARATKRADLPTDERLDAVKKFGLDGDPGFAALYFQYGRYLLISSSRPGGQPANLQGLWNEELHPPWECKWTLNINCEMNYWPAELCNLGECAEPLFDMIDDLVISGGRTAKEQYGSRGWVVHHNTDLWRGTAPINNIDGVWPTGGAWLCHRLWEHYLFAGDKKFLARAYPAMRGASLFFVDDLIKDPKTGWLVTSPSYSPEQGDLCYGPTMDNQLIRALMDHTIAAAAILHKDRRFAAQLAKTRDQLPPNQVGKYGQLQEWLDDIDKPNNNHRHMSPLWALYPGADITPADPKIWGAAKVLLNWRGDGSTGWSYAWRIPLWARVGDGEFAYQQLNGMFQRRTLPNLFDLCGPFQIDGNFGATAGMVELLLQSQWTEQRDGKDLRVVCLLPALPKAWQSGSAKGLCARDGFVLDIAWENGALKSATIHSKLGKPCLLRCGDRELVLQTDPGKDYVFDGELRPAKIIPAKPAGREVDAQTMQRIYDEVKTPFKYGVVLEGAGRGESVDCPSVFRSGAHWYMVYVAITNSVGYQTFLARSDDLLHWKKSGNILPFRRSGWDAWQGDGGIALADCHWNGTHELEKFDGKYWLSYIGGAKKGYETDPLSIGMAWTRHPAWPRAWHRFDENPVLSPNQPDARSFETKTLYKSQIIHDETESLGWPFVMYYNAKYKNGFEQIGMAVSRDMTSWRRYGTSSVVVNGEAKKNGISGDPQIVKIGNVWVMFYFGAGWQPRAFDTFACSYDLVHWTKWSGPNLIQPGEPYDKTYAHKPWVLKYNGVVYHFYCAVGDQGRVIALATSKDLRNQK